MFRVAPFALMVLAACGESPRRPPAISMPITADSSDSAFAQVQGRGQAAMGVDQYTSLHHFESLADGGRISLQRDPADTQGVAQIRNHMVTIAGAFARGDFTLPGFVHDRAVPGTAVMARRRPYIRYMADTLPGGGAVRIQTRDPAAVVAIHEFLAFQRLDHRSAGHQTSH